MKNALLIFLFSLTISSSCAQLKETKTIHSEPKLGIVNNEETAIKVAEALLFSVYGDRINLSRPFKAKLIKENEIWLVEGTLHTDKGGVPFIEIQKKDCKVVKFGHGK